MVKQKNSLNSIKAQIQQSSLVYEQRIAIKAQIETDFQKLKEEKEINLKHRQTLEHSFSEKRAKMQLMEASKREYENKNKCLKALLKA